MKTDLNIRPMTPQEKIYAGLQSSQISGQTGFIGVLVGSFNQQDKDLSIKWNILQESPIKEAFWSEAQSVLKELRNTIFKDRNAMQEYCASHTSFFKSQSADAYGLRVDSARYSYLILCSPQSKDNCLYLYAYSTEALEHHMKKAERGISFITPDYQEKFRVADGERIRIIGADGNFRDRICRYIDDTHFETEGEFGGTLYHICEFAELCEKTGSRVIPLDGEQKDVSREQKPPKTKGRER
mgnify:FL=1